jgi:hypothetical protein
MENTYWWDVTPCSSIDIYRVVRCHVSHISVIMRLPIVDFHENGLICRCRNRFVK